MLAMASPGCSKRKVLLAITIAQQAYYRGIVRYAREHDWHLVMDMTYTGRVRVGWRGDAWWRARDRGEPLAPGGRSIARRGIATNGISSSPPAASIGWRAIA